ncbi:hypothetical protein Ddc_13295 [Ditylenchus destructor]|nr:hypothetical protein Ddc_13295 [Ditylenchus destructor]
MYSGKHGPQCTRIYFSVPEQLKGLYYNLIETLNDKQKRCIKHNVVQPGDTIDCGTYEDLPDDSDSRSDWLACDGDEDSDWQDDGTTYTTKTRFDCPCFGR